MNGAKQTTETMEKYLLDTFGRRAFFERYKFDRTDRCCAQRSENVGMSNEKTGEIPVHRKSKGS